MRAAHAQRRAEQLPRRRIARPSPAGPRRRCRAGAKRSGSGLSYVPHAWSSSVISGRAAKAGDSRRSGWRRSRPGTKGGHSRPGALASVRAMASRSYRVRYGKCQ